MSNKENVKELIAFLLDHDKRSQKEIAEKMGITERTLSNWKSGRTSPYKRDYPKIARVFGYTSEIFDDIESIFENGIFHEKRLLFGSESIKDDYDQLNEVRWKMAHLFLEYGELKGYALDEWAVNHTDSRIVDYAPVLFYDMFQVLDELLETKYNEARRRPRRVIEREIAETKEKINYAREEKKAIEYYDNFYYASISDNDKFIPLAAADEEIIKEHEADKEIIKALVWETLKQKNKEIKNFEQELIALQKELDQVNNR